MKCSHDHFELPQNRYELKKTEKTFNDNELPLFSREMRTEHRFNQRVHQNNVWHVAWIDHNEMTHLPAGAEQVSLNLCLF